jgi:hypothetical protein
MLLSFQAILEFLLAHNTARFLVIWMPITAAAVIGVTLALGQAEAAKSKKETTRRAINLITAWRQVWTPRTVAALTVSAVFLASYIAIILAWEDFTYYDDEYFTLGTLKGHNIPLQITGTGRFYPLGWQEFNLIRHFTDTIAGYHMLPVIQILIFFCILITLDAELSIVARTALAMLILITPSVLNSFSGLIFTERNILFFLAFLMMSVKHFERTHSIIWAVTAAVSAQIMIYYEETASLLLLGFATGRLILRCRSGHHGEWDYYRLWDKESRLDLCFVSLALIFLLYYFAAMGIPPNMDYALRTMQPRAEIVFSYIRVDLLAWVFVALVLGRTYLILHRRVAPLLLWDGLAFGGVTCFLAYLYLSMFSTYYLAPVDLIAVLYIGRFAMLSWKKMRSWGKIAASVLISIVLFQDVLGSAFAMFERKNVIYGKAKIASVVERCYRNGGGNALTLFFPFASPYMIMEFVSYLSYRDVPVEGGAGKPDSPNSVVLAARTMAEDGPCVGWVRIRCHAVTEPAQGDLVIMLPDDLASLAEASMYRQRRELLFFYQPRPALPHWLHSLFDSLHVYATRYTPKTNPDRWMDASVAIWK